MLAAFLVDVLFVGLDDADFLRVLELLLAGRFELADLAGLVVVAVFREEDEDDAAAVRLLVDELREDAAFFALTLP